MNDYTKENLEIMLKLLNSAINEFDESCENIKDYQIITMAEVKVDEDIWSIKLDRDEDCFHMTIYGPDFLKSYSTECHDRLTFDEILDALDSTKQAVEEALSKRLN